MSSEFRRMKRRRLEDSLESEYNFTDQESGIQNPYNLGHESMTAPPYQNLSCFNVEATQPIIQASFDNLESPMASQHSGHWNTQVQPHMPLSIYTSFPSAEDLTYLISAQPPLLVPTPSLPVHPSTPYIRKPVQMLSDQPSSQYIQSSAVNWQPSSNNTSGGTSDFDLLAQLPNIANQPWGECYERSDPEVMVCFGTIPDISGTCDQKSLDILQPEYRVKLESSERFTGLGNTHMSGRIHTEHCQMIQALLEEQSFQLFASCITNTEQVNPKTRKSSRISKCTLDITVYGPMELFEEIGSWLQEYDIYLQDPRLCYMDTKYCNPQRLSSSDVRSCPLVSDVTNRPVTVKVQSIPAQADMLDILSSHSDLKEARQPTAIKTALEKHQKQALTFMLQRESGWSFDQTWPDIWEEIERDQSLIFINKISNTYQTEEPPQFFGGIIADPMGLGKTLTMIALVANDIDLHLPKRSLAPHKSIPDVPSTLIIIPPPLLDSWEEQLSEHTVQGILTWCRHHGKDRLTNIEEFRSVNVILTTYHTVSAEWKYQQATQNSVLYSVNWRRIILDEAHFIRNDRSTMSRAVCALSSVSRWAVTGTPVQNRLNDLSSLLKFIRPAPYNDPRQFDTDISHLWKSGEDEVAVQRLKYLSTCLLLRRPKATIDLPPRKDLLFPVEFRHEERTAYEALRQQAITRIDEALYNDHAARGAIVYANALQQIESLRLFSNMGLHYHVRHDSTKVQDWENVAQQTFNTRREIEPTICKECSSSLDLTESLLDESVPTRHTAKFFSCLRLICGDCIRKAERDGRTLSCGHSPPCSVASVSLSSRAFEEMSNGRYTQANNVPLKLPSKISALVADIQAQPQDVKCIVFSTWRLTLDIVQSALEQASIPCIRFDGKVAQKDRGAVVDRFRRDPSVRVMLLTLSCGAVGLTLTVASRAYLIEPHWNPTLEEQALARIHRLGQKQEVTTIRLYMRDSFEEQVIKVQESKKQLANVLLAPHDGTQTSDSLGTLQNLRMLL
ncbi:SNF2 family N-terminal domain-containing protein [Hypoxylon sp. FL1150]|nr:SNF2 family N-terminal domain-containing protein [Hypoxylon sp. FL1150]